ncbi:MAG: GNAT family N-acetyltransferase, partial [Angustibacter sp.]
SPAPSFAVAHGFAPALRDWRSDLDLPTGSLDELLAPIEAEAQAGSADYEVQSWADTLPARWAEQRAELSARLSTDAPNGEQDLRPEVWDVERVQQSYRILRAQGRRILESIAVHRRSGRAVGHTLLVVPQEPPGLALQWTTLALQAHRGHRLGLALKAANLRSLRRHCPAVRRVVTWNAQENSPMLRINRRLGFEPVGEGTCWQKEVASG